MHDVRITSYRYESDVDPEGWHVLCSSEALADALCVGRVLSYNCNHGRALVTEWVNEAPFTVRHVWVNGVLVWSGVDSGWRAAWAQAGK